MFNKVAATVGFTSVVIAVKAFAHHVKETHPPKGINHQPGEWINTHDKVHYVVGYFGSSHEVHETGINPDRGLFFGPKPLAQTYAKSRAKGENKPVVALIVADRPFKLKELVQGDFAHTALSPEYMKDANVRVHFIEEVTLETEIGLLASLTRAGEAAIAKGLHPTDWRYFKKVSVLDHHEKGE